MRSIGAQRGVGLGLALMALACGAGEDPLARASGARMAPTAVAREQASPRPNRAPALQALALAPDPPAVGETLRAQAQATDPDGDALELRFTWEIGGRRSAEHGAELLLPQSAKGEEVRVWVVASDGHAQSAPMEARAVIRNRAPRISGLALAPAGVVQAGAGLTAEAAAEDPDGDALTLSYVWRVNGELVTGDAPTFSTRGLQQGDRVAVQVTASDGSEESMPESAELLIGNAPPRIVSQPQPPGADGRFVYQIVAQDPEGQRIAGFRLAEGPEGMHVDARTGSVAWEPRPDQAGRHRVELVAADAQGAEASQAFELVVEAPEAAPAAAEPGEPLPAELEQDPPERGPEPLAD